MQEPVSGVRFGSLGSSSPAFFRNGGKNLSRMEGIAPAKYRERRCPEFCLGLFVEAAGAAEN